jgi:hypothetical protein
MYIDGAGLRPVPNIRGPLARTVANVGKQGVYVP